MGRGQKMYFLHQLLVSFNPTDNSASQIQNGRSLIKGKSGERSEKIFNSNKIQPTAYFTRLSSVQDWNGQEVKRLFL